MNWHLAIGSGLVLSRVSYRFFCFGDRRPMQAQKIESRLAAAFPLPVNRLREMCHAFLNPRTRRIENGMGKLVNRRELAPF